MREKDKLIRILSEQSNNYGDKLLEMMDYYDVSNLMCLTEEQIQEWIQTKIELKE